jgi:hypothetical protein
MLGVLNKIKREERKMQTTKNKTKANAIAIFLVLTIAVTLVALPIANAHDPPWTVPTWSYVAVTNSVIGVNQPITIVFWDNAVPPTAQGAYGDRWTWTIEITKPDGSNETLGPFTSDPIGGGWASYTPTQTGVYTIVARMAEHKITGSPNGFPPGFGPFSNGYANVNDTYTGSDSDPVTVTVQEEAIQPWQETPLPTEYWTRPINSANRNWDVLAGNWLAGAAQNVGPTTRFSYGLGPESAHVMWATPMWAGGIMDERFGETGFATGHYEGTDFVPPIILDGKIFYNVQSLPREGWYCLDLYTGETLYFHNTTGPATGFGGGFDASGRIAGEELAFGQIYNYESPNQHGGIPYLWSTSGGTPVMTMTPFGMSETYNTWMMFDAFTGNYICSIGNVPDWVTTSLGPFAALFGGGAMGVYGKDGSILSYNIAGTPNPNPMLPAGPPFYLQCWNTSRAIWYEPVWYSNEYWMWRPTLNMTFDGNNGYSLNASIPDVTGASIRAVREDQYMIVGTTGKNNGTYVLQGWLAALNLKPDANGVINPTMLWNITFTPPQSVPDVATGMFGAGGVVGPTLDPEDGVFLFSESITRRRWGYSLETGQLLWGPTESEPAMNYYMMMTNIYQGMLLSTGFGGVLIAYDIKTGKQLWNYTAEQVGFESPYGNYPMGITAIADGKIYLVTGEHSVTQPMWRGFLRCVNASNGAELWKILHWGADGGASLMGTYVVMADGYVVGLNQYDSRIYCYGKGPSATTVAASPEISVNGNSVLIKGTVTDQCAGAKEVAQKLGFVNGVPAIADESMEAWMEYLYMQQLKPTNATGVDVSLDTLDPNGNFIHIDTVTSDDSGLFSYMWTPEVPGKYTVIATFEGTKSYYSSYAETAVGVSEAPPTTAPPEYPQPIDYTWTIIGAAVVLLVAMVLVGVWIKRK